MLISKELIINVNDLTKNNIGYYKNRFIFDIISNSFIIPINDLPKSSKLLVDAKCHYCNNVYKIVYKSFNNNIKNINKYNCNSKKCISDKKKEVFLEKYGVDNYSKTDEYKIKFKKTILEKYGVDHYSKTDEYKEKVKETTLSRYGVSSYAKTDECKDKIKNTCLSRYGVDNYSKTTECTDKIKETNIEKYGVNHYSKTDEYINKIRKTNIEKYGVDHYSKTDEYKESFKQTCLEKYGVDHYSKTDEYKEKTKKTSLERYGVEYVSQTEWFKENVKNFYLVRYGVDHFTKTDEYKEKTKKTSLERYGVEYYTQTNESKERFKQTCLEKYGIDNYSKTTEYKNKVKDTCLENHGVDSYSKTEEYKVKIKETSLSKYGTDNYTKTETHHINTIIGNDVNYIRYLYNGISLFNCDKVHTFEINIDNYHNRIKNNIPLCTICNPIGDSKSIKEKDLYEYIKSVYSGEIIQSYRDKLEIDIYLPELNLGFEFNGLYWHSEKYKEKNYHLDKTNYFKDKGIRIIHIWEDDWIFKQDIVKSQISNLLGNSDKIYARKCSIKEVSVKSTRKFLDDNHVQGFVNSSFKIGLYYQDELVSIMTFDSFEGRKKMEEGGYNLSRFCNKLGYNIIGGASKLLKHFITNYKASRIVSYADKDWSVGSLYYILGFNNVGGNGPDYKYIVDNKRVHKSRYKKSNLKIQDTDITEAQATRRLGISRIYDCGKIKFEYKKRAS